MKTLTPSLEKLISPLRGLDESRGNEHIRMSIYPCRGCDCGTVMFWMAYANSDTPILNIGLSDSESVKIATSMFNYINRYENPMTPKNFLSLLNHVFVTL